jgi:hypothetical protein
MLRRSLALSSALALAAFPTTAAATPSPSGPERLESVVVQPGYVLAPLATGLDFPTGIAMDGQRIWVSEASITPQDPAPKVVELAPDGTATEILTPADVPQGAFLPPLIDVTHHEEMLWVTHRQKGVNDWLVGAVSRFDPDDPAGTFTTVLTNLPSQGDHFTEEIVFGEDGRGYFLQGSATNTSVVGPDNELVTGWLSKAPQFHDFPAKDVVLSGVEYTTENPLAQGGDLNEETPAGEDVVTAPFMPFGSGPVEEGTTVSGATPESPQEGIIAGNGAAYSFDPAAEDVAATLRLEAWGLRNTFGLGFDPFDPSALHITNNGADVRTVAGPEASSVPPMPFSEEELVPVGARPVTNDFDDMFVIPVGGTEEFMGWPDYFHDPETGAVMPITDELFCTHPQRELPECPHQFALAEDFRESLAVEDAFVQFQEHGSANKFDFSTSRRFGFLGDPFVAETGSFVPITGAVEFTGYRVVRVDHDAADDTAFIANVGETVDEVFNPDSFNKPIDVKFDSDVMTIVDFGVFEPGLNRMQPGTGKVWLVAHGPARPPGGRPDLPAGVGGVPAVTRP